MVNSQATPRSKRQKVSMACEPCRARKTKCDGRPPVCGPCHRRGGNSSTCEWEHAPTREDCWSQQFEYIRHLESRLDELQQRQQAFQAKEPLSVDEISTSTGELATASSKGRAASGFEEHNRDRGPLTPITVAAGRPPHTKDSIFTFETPVPAMLGPSTERSADENYCSNSSASSFMHHIRKVTGKARFESADPGNTVPLYPNDEYDDAFACMDYVLPPRKTADGLMEVYWTYVHNLYPVLGRRVTMRDYQALWTANGVVPHERSFHCLLNIMLALSSQITPSAGPDERARSSIGFYRRAKGLLSHTNTASIRNVQIYLLFGLYLQSTNKLHDCWIFVGLAIRTAQSLDLHLAETSKRHPHPRQKVILRRVWYGCVLMDRALAMVSGRPCTIHLAEALAVDYPTPVEGEIFPVEPSCLTHGQGDTIPTIVDFFNNTLTLCDILYDILRTFYKETRTTPASPVEIYDKYFGGLRHSISSIDERLSAWERSQPRHLRMQTYSRDHNVSPLSRQAVVLRQRFLHVRILSLRPVLSEFLVLRELDCLSEYGLRAGLSLRALVQCSVTCFRAAQEAIKLVYAKRSVDPKAMSDLSSWWDNILFVYTAATVIIAVRLKLSVFSELTEADVSDTWQQAIATLQYYNEFETSISGMIGTLQFLYNSAPQNSNGDDLFTVDSAFDFGVNADASLPDITAMLTATTEMPLDMGDALLFDTSDIFWVDASPFHA